MRSKTKISQIQLNLLFVYCYVLHRNKSREIHRPRLYNILPFVLPKSWYLRIYGLGRRTYDIKWKSADTLYFIELWRSILYPFYYYICRSFIPSFLVLPLLYYMWRSLPLIIYQKAIYDGLLYPLVYFF